MNVLNVTELYTLKWLILYHVNLTSVKKNLLLNYCEDIEKEDVLYDP